MFKFFNKATDKFSELSLSKQLFYLMFSMSVGIILAIGISDYRNRQVLVKGTQYQQIILQKDLVADVLPPPMYLIEAWKVCLEMVADKTASIPELIKTSQGFSKDFSDRHDYWADNLDKNTRIEEEMNKSVYLTGLEFLRIRDKQFFNAILAKNEPAISQALSDLKQAYNLHRLAVDKVVKSSNATTLALEAQTNELINQGRITTVAMTILLLAYSAFMSVLVISSIRKKLGAEASRVLEVAQKLAQGDLSYPIETKTYNSHSVMESIKTLQDNLNGLVNSLNLVSEEQAKGDYDIKLNTEKFQGSYKIMAEKVNEMLAINAKEMQAVMNCMRGFGEGEFNASIPTFLGKKYSYNQKIENIRNNLQILSADAFKLTQAAEMGHLNIRADATKHKGDFRQIIEGVNNTLNIILKPIASVNEVTSTINMIADEIASSNTNLAKRTEQQAVSLEETAATTEELSVTVKRNADNAAHASELANTATEVAIKGSSDVENVVKTMVEINNSAGKISDIISVIDGIAFQTNILALNAAVEAARAGEQGRGFAVVAGEVRSLAQRSSNAAKEIKDLINNSVKKTHEGTLHVEHAGRTMEAVVESIKSVGKLVSEIADASREQSVGLQQINVAISKLDDTTQQNVVMVQQAAVSAASLTDQTKALFETVSVFKSVKEQEHSYAYQRNWSDNKSSNVRQTQQTPSKNTISNDSVNMIEEEWDRF